MPFNIKQIRLDLKEASDDMAKLHTALSVALRKADALDENNFILVTKQKRQILNSYIKIWKKNYPKTPLNLQALDLSHTNLTDINLEDADLKMANLYGTVFYRTNLQNADLRDANISFNLYSHSPKLRNTFRSDYAANLMGANLENAHLQSTNLTNSDMRKANLKNTNLYLTNLSEANLSEADLRECLLRDTILNKANLKKAKIQRAIFCDTKLVETDMEGANLRDAIDINDCLTSAKNTTERQLTRAIRVYTHGENGFKELCERINQIKDMEAEKITPRTINTVQCLFNIALNFCKTSPSKEPVKELITTLEALGQRFPNLSSNKDMLEVFERAKTPLRNGNYERAITIMQGVMQKDNLLSLLPHTLLSKILSYLPIEQTKKPLSQDFKERVFTNLVTSFSKENKPFVERISTHAYKTIEKTSPERKLIKQIEEKDRKSSTDPSPEPHKGRQ